MYFLNFHYSINLISTIIIIVQTHCHDNFNFHLKHISNLIIVHQILIVIPLNFVIAIMLNHQYFQFLEHLCSEQIHLKFIRIKL
jgi:hypothetical protein